MNRKESAILKEYAGGAQALLCVRSRTRLDTGSWLLNRRVWICVFETELVVLAASRRRFVQKFPLAEIGGSHYSHSTGEFVIEPSEGLRYYKFKVTAREALSILKLCKPAPAPAPTPQPTPSIA